MKCPPLVQEVVYNGILKKDRRSIHEKAARKIENMFADRLNPYYETLTFEYLLGRIHLQTALHGGCLSVGRCQQVDGKRSGCPKAALGSVVIPTLAKPSRRIRPHRGLR